MARRSDEWTRSSRPRSSISPSVSGSGREQRLAVLVDSKTPADSPYIGMMQFLVASGGITSHVRLEARPDPQLDRIRLRAEPGLKGILASVSARRSQAGTAWQGRCRVRVLNADDATAAEGETPLAFAADSTLSGTAELWLAFPELAPVVARRPLPLSRRSDIARREPVRGMARPFAPGFVHWSPTPRRATSCSTADRSFCAAVATTVWSRFTVRRRRTRRSTLNVCAI